MITEIQVFEAKGAQPNELIPVIAVKGDNAKEVTKEYLAVKKILKEEK